MMVRPHNATLLVAGALVFLFAAMARAAQEPPQDPPAPPSLQAAPPVLPLDAIQLAAKMEEAAPKKFRKWARNYAKESFFDREDAPAIEALITAVGQRAPRARPESLRAGALLVAYLGYVHGNETQTIIGARLVELNRQIRDLEEQVRMLESSPLRRNARDPRGATVADEQRALQRLDELVRQRDFHRNHMASFQPKVDACLERLAALYEQVKETDADAVRKL